MQAILTVVCAVATGISSLVELQFNIFSRVLIGFSVRKSANPAFSSTASQGMVSL
jgi:hypothetical protein